MPQATAAPPPPLVADGGFEQDGGWTLESSMQRVAGEGRQGSSALRVPGDGSWNNAFRSITLPEPGCYALAAWVRDEATRTAALYR